MDISATALAPISASTDLDLDEWCGPESRDHVSEFGDRLAEFLPDGEAWIPAIKAADFVAHLRAVDPDLLNGFLHASAPAIVTAQIGTWRRHDRRISTRRAGAVDFELAVSNGEIESFVRSPFAERFSVNAENLTKPIGLMTKADHIFVADRYRRDERAAGLGRAFHEAIAKRLRSGQTTADVLSVSAYCALRESITA